jgi:hypothetical protein
MDFKLRRILAVLVLVAVAIAVIVLNPESYQGGEVEYQSTSTTSKLSVSYALEKLDVKGRAPRTGYARDEFGRGWGQINGCDTRNIILKRDLKDTVLEGCLVMRGTLRDPYTDTDIALVRGKNSNAVQIDHVVSLSNAWQTGAQYLSVDTRKQLANDPINLMAVDGPANQQKGDGDAATWLPPNKPFRCKFVARQVSVKFKYRLWVTAPEKTAILNVLKTCPNEKIIQ